MLKRILVPSSMSMRTVKHAETSIFCRTQSCLKLMDIEEIHMRAQGRYRTETYEKRANSNQGQD